MDAILWVIVGLAVVLGLVTVIGHGIWVMLAAIFGGPKGKEVGKCVFCGRASHDGQLCEWCGRDLTTPLAAELADLEVVRRQLQRFRAGGTLAPQAVDRLLERLNNYRRQLLAPKSAQVPLMAEILPEEPVGVAPAAPLVTPPPSSVPPPVLDLHPAETYEVIDAKPQAAVASVAPSEPAIAPKPPPAHVQAPPPLSPPRLPPLPPAAPRRSWSEILAAFMEERNIHWGELIGGLLIVCSSTALVVSLWQQLKTIPYFQFFIFVTITSAIFGVGLYAHHRWKLASTSRGILVIATLLVPLNFVAMAGMSKDAWTPAALVPQLASLAIFAWLVVLAAGVIAGGTRQWLALAVLGNSAAMLAIVPLTSSATSAAGFLTAGGACAGLFAAAVVAAIFRSGKGRLDATQCSDLFHLLGIAGFATAVAVGLLIVQVASRAELAILLHRCSPLLALTALPVMAAGMTVQRGTRRQASLDSFRLAGTTIALVALAGMLAALCLAWPHPEWIIAVGLFDMLALAWAAFRWRMPMFHAGAIACAALAFLTAFHLVAGDLPMPAGDVSSADMLRLTLSARSGMALCGLFWVLLAISEWLARRGYRRHGVYYMGGCAAAAAAGLVLTTYHGLAHGAADALRAAILYGIYGSGSLALAARWRRVEFSYLGLFLVAAVLPWGFAAQAAREFGPHWGLLLAAEALVLAAAAVSFTRLRIGSIYLAPLAHLAEAAAALAVVLAVAAGLWTAPPKSIATATCLAAACFLMSARYASSWRASTGQALLYVAAVLGAATWLQHAGAISRLEQIVDDPANLQVCGFALALLSLAWILVRIVAGICVGWDKLAERAPAHQGRSSVGLHSQARLSHPTLLSFLAHRESVDRMVRHAVVAGQFFLLIMCLVPAVQAELAGPAFSAGRAFGPAAWLMTGVLALSLLAALWDQWRDEDLIAAVLLTATAAGLVAGRFGVAAALGAPAAASALRWGLGIALLIVSAGIWQRARLAAWGRAIHARVELETSAARIARGAALIAMAAPVLLITIYAAALQLSGTAPRGPAAGSFFANVGPTWSYLVPLALVIASLVGHALRERSSAYAFAAGLVLELAVALGYSLHVSLSKQAIDPATFFVTLVQWATIAAAVWAILWLVARRQVDVWREDRAPPSPPAPLPKGEGNVALPRVLMDIQIGMAAAGNAVLLGGALFSLTLVPTNSQEWCVAAGRLPGWFALVLPVVAIMFRGRLRPNVAGLVGMAVLGLLACTVRGIGHFAGHTVDPVWGYRTLMLGWAVYSLVVVLAAWWAASLRPQLAERDEYFGPPQALLRMAAVWVRAAAVLAVLLGLKAAFFHEGEQLWAAAAIALASGASATMAVWRRREGWAFATAWGVNLAASLVVWHFELLHHHSFEQWWLRLVQANIIATSAVALVWLAARRRLYELRELGLGDSPLLALQIAVAVVAQALLLVPPLSVLLHSPEALPAWTAEVGARPGWLGLLLTAAAASWYLRQIAPEKLVHALGGLALAAGVLAASAASVPGAVLPPRFPWPAYHVLLAAWTAAAVILLLAGIIGGWLGGRFDFRVRPQSPDELGGPADSGLQSLLPPGLIELWVSSFGILAAALALLHGFYDPLRPWWPAGTVITVAGIAAAMALWRRRVEYVYISSVLINAAGVLMWWAKTADGLPLSRWTAETSVSLLMANAVCLAAGSIVWSVLGRLGSVAAERSAGPPRYCKQAAWFGTALLVLSVIVGTMADLTALPHTPVRAFDWISLVSIAVAAAVGLWDRSPRGALQMFYCLGLAAAGMWLWSKGFAPQKFYWAAGGELACFTLASATLGWLLPRLHTVWTAFRIPADAEDESEWFSLAQAAMSLIVAALAVWGSTDVTFNGIETRFAQFGLAGRTAGPLALVALLGTTIVMAAGRSRAAWQSAAFGCGVLLGCCLGWSKIDPALAAPWLHGSIAVIVAAAVVTLIAGIGLAAVMPRGSDWIARGRQSAPLVAGLAAAMTFAVLVQEGARFEMKLAVPLAAWEIAVVAAMFVAMTATGIALAVVPQWDPLRQNDRQRQIYVYLAEAVGLLLGFHLRYTMPWLFQGYFRLYWMFVVLAGAFLGAGLSEIFHRRKMPVLAVPLERTAMLLPLLPAVGFWIMPEPTGPWSLIGRSPPMWFMMALFYAVVAASRRSGLATVLAVLACNMGLWAVLNESNVPFLRHPQIWLIPIALAALVAEHFHRHRIAESQRLAVRYLALSVIYLSSTADLWIAGLQDWRLALVLMVLSVAGVLLGILLQVRSFLYLGVTFLVVDLLSMFWYAAVQRGHTWVWYASGIVLGAAIIALFAVFEKRRNDVLAAVQRLKAWQR